MSEPQSISPTKRRHSSGPEPAAKLRRPPSEAQLGYPEDPGLGYYAGLSNQYLTRKALVKLDQLDRINAPPRPAPIAADVVLPADLYMAFCIPEMVKRLQSFALGGGPDLTGLRKSRNPPTAPEDASNPSGSRSGRRSESNRPNRSEGDSNTSLPSSQDTGPFDTNFQQHLFDCRIMFFRVGWYPDSTPRPDNMEEIKRAIKRSIAGTLSVSQINLSLRVPFMTAHDQAMTKAQIMANVIPLLEGETGGVHHVAGGIPFTNLSHLTHEPLVAAKPDLFHGAPPEDMPAALRDALYNMIVPSADDGVPVAPNFFLCVASPNVQVSHAIRKACYCGALGARGIHSLQVYKQPEPDYHNRAFALTSIYHRGKLEMYAIHLTPPPSPGQQPGYAMTPLGSYSLILGVAAFRRGVLAWRNGRDWAQRERDEALKQASYVANEWMLS